MESFKVVWRTPEGLPRVSVVSYDRPSADARMARLIAESAGDVVSVPVKPGRSVDPAAVLASSAARPVATPAPAAPAAPPAPPPAAAPADTPAAAAPEPEPAAATAPDRERVAVPEVEAGTLW